MTVRIVCSLRNIIPHESIYDFKFDEFRFIKGSDLLDSNIFTQNFINQVGVIGAREFINYPFILKTVDASPEELPEIASKAHNQINELLLFLWLSKNTSVNVGNLICFIPDTEYLFLSTKLASFSNSKGLYQETEIHYSDFEYANRAYIQFKNLASKEQVISRPPMTFDERPRISDSDFHFVDYNKNTRIEKAVSFLTMARANSFLPLKISLYMSFLECLFTTDKQEVTHKVCERVALYIGDSFDERKRIYNEIKLAYNIRSSFFHGQNIDKKRDKRDKLEIHSDIIDVILRDVTNRVLFKDFVIFNSDDDSRSELFERILFTN